jgi:hypothetical protein
MLKCDSNERALPLIYTLQVASLKTYSRSLGPTFGEPRKHCVMCFVLCLDVFTCYLLSALICLDRSTSALCL